MFLKLTTQYDGSTAVVNMDRVEYFSKQNGGTNLYLPEEGVLSVTETVDEILTKMTRSR